METKACDGGKGDVAVGDAVEAQVGPVNAGWSTHVAAFELAFSSLQGQPGLLRALGWCSRRNDIWVWEEGVGESRGCG